MEKRKSKKIKNVMKPCRTEICLDRPNWDNTFMHLAYEFATRSSCLKLNTGAVIVKDKRPILGYNGAPPGIENCLERGCRKDKLGISFDEKGTGNCRGVHAEVNVMRQLSRKELIGTTMYTVFYPCSRCAKEIVSNGVAEVVYDLMYEEPDSLTKELFQEAGIKLRRLHPDLERQFTRIKRIRNQKYKGDK